MNIVQLSGRVTADVTLQKTLSGKSFARFVIANHTPMGKPDENGKREIRTTFVQCVAWGNQAEKIAESYKKGSYIKIKGPITVDQWTDADQKPHSRTYVAARSIVEDEENAENAEKAESTESTENKEESDPVEA